MISKPKARKPVAILNYLILLHTYAWLLVLLEWRETA